MPATVTIPITDLLSLKSSFQAAISIIDKKLHDEESGAVSTAPARKGMVKPAVTKAVENRMKRYAKRK